VVACFVVCCCGHHQVQPVIRPRVTQKVVGGGIWRCRTQNSESIREQGELSAGLEIIRLDRVSATEFGQNVSSLRPIPENEDRCGFDPTPDRAAAAPE
jgi:hypothetical protein